MSIGSPTVGRATWREVGALALALASLTWLFLTLSDGGVLFSRPLWTDELHTALLAGRSSPLAVLSDLANGADYGPPLLELATWLMRVVAGTLTPTLLRLFSLACVIGMLLLVYVILRRRFDQLPSVAGTLAVASHELVVAHSFEARFYGPWLLCAAFVASTLSMRPGRRRDVALAIASVLLATIHWYGVVSLGIMMVAAVASHGSRWREGLRHVAPSALGFLAFAFCLPLAVGQRHALTVNTWVPEFRMSQVETMSRLYWTALVPSLAMALFLFATLLRARPARDGQTTPVIVPPVADSGVYALASLALMPVALAAMSLLGQPSMWPRYGIVSALAWAPLVAVATQLAGKWPARAVAAVAIALWFVHIVRESQFKRTFAIGVARQLAAVRQAETLGVPVVFQSMHAMYAAASANWAHRGETSFLEIPDSTMNAVFPRGGRFEALNKALRVERDVARVHSRRFGFPRLSAQRALDSLPRFVLVASDDNMPPGYSGVEGIAVAVFPHHRLARLAPGLLLFDRSGAPAPPALPRPAR